MTSPGDCLRYEHPTGVNSDNYEARYPPDPNGEEIGEDARVWRVYLDEAEAHDAEMVGQWKDTVDSLLVFVSSLYSTNQLHN